MCIYVTICLCDCAYCVYICIYIVLAYLHDCVPVCIYGTVFLNMYLCNNMRICVISVSVYVLLCDLCAFVLVCLFVCPYNRTLVYTCVSMSLCVSV